MIDAALAAKWERRLRDDGMGIDEDSAADIVRISDKSLRVGTAAPGAEDYYVAARALLDTHVFRSIRDRRVWEIHAEGAGAGIIARELRCSRWQVQLAVARGKKAMGVAVPAVYFSRDKLAAQNKMCNVSNMAKSAVAAVGHMRVEELLGVARALTVGLIKKRAVTT